jgi:hypothetical protein
VHKDLLVSKETKEILVQLEIRVKRDRKELLEILVLQELKVPKDKKEK